MQEYSSFNHHQIFSFLKQCPKKILERSRLYCYIFINRLLITVLDFKNSVETLYYLYPTINVTNRLLPQIFGYIVFVHIHSYQRGKLYPCALKCVFVRYSSQKQYKSYHAPTQKFCARRRHIC